MRKTFAIALLTTLVSIPLAAQDPDFGAAADEAVVLLQSMIRINSSSPPGNETEVCQFIRDVLAAEGIDSKIVQVLNLDRKATDAA